MLLLCPQNVAGHPLKRRILTASNVHSARPNSSYNQAESQKQNRVKIGTWGLMLGPLSKRS